MHILTISLQKSSISSPLQSHLEDPSRVGVMGRILSEMDLLDMDNVEWIDGELSPVLSSVREVSKASRKDASDNALNEVFSPLSSPGVDGSPDEMLETGITLTFTRIEEDSKYSSARVSILAIFVMSLFNLSSIQ